jgi:hypothetical protein
MLAQGPLTALVYRVSESHIAWHPTRHWSVTLRSNGQIRLLDVDHRREYYVLYFHNVLDFFGPGVSADPGWQLL